MVIRTHAHAVGASRRDRKEVSRGNREGPRLGKEVGRFTDRTYYVVERLRSITRYHGKNLVPGVVERRAQEVVHCGIDDGEVLRRPVLEVLDSGEQQAGVAHQ